MHCAILKPGKAQMKQYELTIYVVKGPTVKNLVSGRAAKEMGMVKRIDEISTTISDKGKLKTEPVKNQLRKGAESYAVNTAHRVTSLLQKVSDKLGRMEAGGVI